MDQDIESHKGLTAVTDKSKAKLNQIIAIEKGEKGRAESAITSLYKQVQKPALFAGIQRVYQPLADDGEQLPPENQRVQLKYETVLENFADFATNLMKITARKDWTNLHAVADVKLDGMTLISGVPVTYLLFLEKRLADMRTLIEAIPTLDESDEWNVDTTSKLNRSVTIQTHRSKKLNKPLVMAPATDKHPAQVQLVSEDILVGNWNTTKLSGAMPPPEKKELLERVEALSNAVKEAREEANMHDEMPSPDVGTAIFQYLIGT